MTIEITGTAAIRKEFHGFAYCILRSLVLGFLPFALRETRATVILRLALRLDMRRVAFIDG